MYFKSLELLGFKSFAEKTKLDFELGITAIVGPNGCGKCLHGDTLVYLADGETKPIRDIVEDALNNSKYVQKLDDGFCSYANLKGLKVFSLNPRTLKIEAKEISAFIKRKSPEFLLRARTNSGKEIITTHYHPFFILDEKNGLLKALKAEELREGLRIALPRKINLSAGSEKVYDLRLLERFSREDSVYIPYSKRLVDFIENLKSQCGTLTNLARSSGVDYEVLCSVFDKQAINIFHLTRLSRLASSAGNSEDKNIFSELKSAGTGKIELPKKVDGNVARFLGYIISEGRNTSTNQVWFVNEDKAVISDFIKVSKKAFGVEAKTFSYKNSASRDVIIFSHALCKTLDRVFDVGISEKSSDKKVPEQILSSKDEIVAEFLSALFEGDGYVSFREDKNGKKTVYIEYATASRRLARDVSSLLLRFGVWSVIREKTKCAYNTKEKIKRSYYSVYIYGLDNFKTLSKILNFKGRKQQALKKIRELEYVPNPNMDLIPNTSELLRKFIKDSAISIKKSKKICPKVEAYYRNICLPSRRGMIEVLEYVKKNRNGKAVIDIKTESRLKAIAGSDIFWDKIVKIENVKPEEWVYDLCVDDTHNFIANNIFVHNSNIADAIKWVLGEQSAKDLRGSQMQDVIFNGTDGREPVSYAEVSLTLSNQDRALPIEYDEITVTRRLYRSGESEYLLNKTPVRLKDINELFMGTGIGTSAYSLIEQGMIGQILSSKPEERREVFEEASGITKYKSKKKEALRKLEDTEQNLLRLNDIIAEVNRQINSIERQAKKAERYKEKYEELKELELRLSRIELELLNQALSESNSNLDELKAKEAQFSSDLQKLSASISESGSDRLRIESKRMEFRSNMIKIDSDISKHTDKASLNKERIEELKKKRIDLESEIEKGREVLASQQKEVENLRGKLSILEKEDISRLTTLNEKEKRLEEISKGMAESEAIISTSKANIMDIASRQSKLRNHAAKVATALATNDARLKRLNIEKENVAGEKNDLVLKLDETIKEIDSIEKDVISLRQERDNIAGEISNLSQGIEGLAEKSKNLQKDLTISKSRLEILEEAKAKYEGFSSGVKAILEKSGQARVPIDGIRDVLANLLSVKKGYEAAIESALGDYLQSIVVESMESAEKAIDFIKKNSYGKVSFIHPASYAYTDSVIKDINLKHERLLGRALDFIEMDNILKKAVAALLKNIYLVRGMEDARFIMKENRLTGDCTFITLSGEVLQNGFVSGGILTKEDSSILNRDMRIREFSLIINKLEKDSSQIEEERIANENKKASLEEALKGINAKSNEKEIIFANAKSRSSNIEENIKGIEDEMSLVGLEMDEVTSEIERLRQEEKSIGESLARAEKDANLNEERIKTNEDLLSSYAKEKEKLIVEAAEQRTELGALESKKEGLANTLSILETSFRDAQKSLESRRFELEGSIRKVEELGAESVSLEKEIQDLSKNRIGSDRGLEEVESLYSDIIKNIEGNETIFKKLEEEVNKLRAGLHQIDLKKAQTGYGIDNLKQRIRDVYKLDLDSIQIIEGWESLDQAQLKSEVEEKRAKLDAMGPVNLVAIEEHTELKDRFAFLTHQRDDLLSAKDSLLKAIAKINKTTKDLFIETFNNIQTEFRSFFKMLFNGGDGELILLDQDNILESGIEIVARPPGKRLQNVSLLSGGEKALTAIALIFAIFKVKPSTFCVLDEIDAPLDESNVERFSRVLEMFTKTSQFIIITHNKKTIDMADVMYGITMQQSGISKVVSVKFSDPKKQEAAQAA